MGISELYTRIVPYLKRPVADQTGWSVYLTSLGISDDSGAVCSFRQPRPPATATPGTASWPDLAGLTKPPTHDLSHSPTLVVWGLTFVSGGGVNWIER